MRTTTNHTAGLIGRARGALSALLKAGIAASFLVGATVAGGPIAPAQAAADRSLSFYNLHTKERATIVYKRGNRYDPAGLKQINYILRDWRRNEQVKMDPQLLDLVWEVYQRSGSRQPINIICGYRAPATNSMLRSRSRGVAKNSQHTRGKALDFFLPDVPLAKLRAIGLQMQAGGVGFYPTSGSPFVHMDTGSVRHWPRMTRQQLVKVFPNGKTLHVPSDGKPLPGYEQALAAYKARKASGGAVTMLAEATPKKGWSLFGGRDDEEAEDSAAAATTVAAAAPPPRAPEPEPRAEPRLLEETDVAALMPTPRPSPMREAAPDQIPFAVAQAEPDPNMPMPRPSPVERVAFAANEAPVPEAAGTAVGLRREGAFDAIAAVVGADAGETAVMAYAAPEMAVPETETKPTATMTAPLRASVSAPYFGVRHPATSQPSARVAADPLGQLIAADFDGDVMRLLVRNGSTRQKPYALLEKPRPFAIRTLFVSPNRTFVRGFARTAYDGLRTDRFSGPLIQPIETIDLAANAEGGARTRLVQR